MIGAERILWQNTSGIEHALKVKGTLPEWQEHVAGLCAGNSRLAFSVSIAPAASLLYWFGEESGGFNLVGDSSIGKTTVQRIAGSFWGGSNRPGGYLRSWRSTANGLEAMAQIHCDCLLCLDELSQVEPREAGQIVYMVGNGMGKSRARRDGSGRPVAIWRLLVLSSGEITLADKIAEDYRHTRARAGHSVRMIDIPADAGKGYGIFENLHSRADGHTLVKELGAASNTYYGTACRAFIAALQKERPDAIERVRKRRDEWKSQNCPPGADAQVERVASRFGLVAAAGELATKYGILPWGEDEADWAAGECFDAWLKRRGFTGAADIEGGIAAVRKFIELHGDSRFFPAWSPPVQDRVTVNRAGFRHTVDDKTEFFVLPEVWRTEVLNSFEMTIINKALIDRGLLIPDKQGHACKSERISGFGTMRVYHLSPTIIGE